MSLLFGSLLNKFHSNGFKLKYKFTYFLYLNWLMKSVWCLKEEYCANGQYNFKRGWLYKRKIIQIVRYSFGNEFTSTRRSFTSLVFFSHLTPQTTKSQRAPKKKSESIRSRQRMTLSRSMRLASSGEVYLLRLHLL